MSLFAPRVSPISSPSLRFCDGLLGRALARLRHGRTPAAARFESAARRVEGPGLLDAGAAPPTEAEAAAFRSGVARQVGFHRARPGDFLSLAILEGAREGCYSRCRASSDSVN
ncbi:unnamed protein product [Prorocentrum cordatum]|uniref:Uncharacterized protein n=1 Tax=Prorocentrum cordatum TaxID=2364126 RepID=A0ABN9PJR5_9DINO|nr:unnamed protein product [Polarella glacialis]